MHVRGRVLEEPALAQVADDLIRGVTGRGPVQPAVLGEEAPALVDGNEDRQVVDLRQVEVLRARAGRDVDDARAFVERDLVPGDDAMDDLLRRRKVVVRAFVLESDELGPANALEESVVREPLDGNPFSGVALAVLRLRVDRSRHVRRERPRRRRPHHE